MANPISESDIAHIRKHGYAIIPNFLSPEELIAARAAMFRYYPTAEELAATPERYGGIIESGDQLQNEFPFSTGRLNDMATLPEIVSMVTRLLGTPDVLLTQAAIWAKYAGAGDYEQGLHLDYQGNTLVVPRDDGDYRQVNMIVYYTDVTADLGPTCVVSKEKTKARGMWPPFRTRKDDPQLYKMEKKVIVKAGSMLIFGMCTWHRASAIEADFGIRLSQHLIYRAARHGFQGYHLWSHFGERKELSQFISRATLQQRKVLGFPEPGHEYWNELTIKAVAMRYPKMDLSPYRKALKKK